MDNKTTNQKPQKQKKRIPDENAPLTEKQKAFCRHYIENGGNGKQAAIKAGYTERSATSTSATILTYPNVIKEIDRLNAKKEKKTIASAQEVMEFFTKVMNGEVKDQFGLDASLADRTKAAQELAKRTVDIENRIAGKPDATVAIKLDWKR